MKHLVQVFLISIFFWLAPFQGNTASYHSYQQIDYELHEIENNYHDIAKVFSIGETTEGRNIWAIKISDNVSENKSETGVLIVGCHHAREWISVEIPLYLAKYLTDNYSTDCKVNELVDNTEIWIVPMLNPDGHEYSRTTYRLWRKNRRNNGDGSFGVDLNRNYGYKWGGAGSSGDTFSDVYRGPSEFSEPETQAIRDLIISHDIKAYFPRIQNAIFFDLILTAEPTSRVGRRLP